MSHRLPPGPNARRFWKTSKPRQKDFGFGGVYLPPDALCDQRVRASHCLDSAPGQFPEAFTTSKKLVQTFANPVMYLTRRSGSPRLSLNDNLTCRASAGILL